MTTSQLSNKFVPRKRPQQVRAQETVNRVMDAARKILREDGVDALTTRTLAEVSGVRTGSIYQYFGKKEEIFFALYDARLKESVEAFDKVFTQNNLALPFEEFWGKVTEALASVGWGQPEDIELDKAISENPALRDAIQTTLQRLFHNIIRMLRHYGSTWPEQDLQLLSEYLFGLNHFGYAYRIRAQNPRAEQTLDWTNQVAFSLLKMAITEPTTLRPN